MLTAFDARSYLGGSLGKAYLAVISVALSSFRLVSSSFKRKLQHSTSIRAM